MAHTYVANYIHMVFSTKNRENSIPDAPRIHQYLGGIARDAGAVPLAVGGTTDHVHILMSLPATISIARAAQIVKGGSSRWIHESFTDKSRFAWQEAYGAFSIGVSQIDATVEYIANQEQHHRRRDYRAELIAFLKRNRITYDERYLLG